MSPWTRAGLGAVIGALLVLMAHPLSGPYYHTYFWLLGDSSTLARSPYLASNVRTPPEPKTDLYAAYWVTLAALSIERGQAVSRSDAEKIARLCVAYAELEPENAFWRQALSFMLWELGDWRGAREAWSQASYAARWNDFETARLEIVAYGLQRESGGAMGWHFAALYPYRTTATARLIKQQARRILSGPFESEREEHLARLATLANGTLLRQNARSLLAGEVGARIVESSYRPAWQAGPGPSLRQETILRYRFIDALRESGLGAEADQADALYRENEGWLALANMEEARERFARATWWALVLASTPGISLLLAVVGAGLALAGLGLERSRGAQIVFSPTFSVVIGTALALAVYAVSKMIAPALWVVLLCGFFAFVPARFRSRLPSDLGAGFTATIAVLAALIAGLLGYFAMGLGAPGIRLLPILEVPKEYGSGSVVILAISLIFLGLTLATAPAWGLVQRYPAPRLAGVALKRLGSFLMVGCIVVALVTGPAAVFADRPVAEMLQKQLKNEPLFLMR